MTDKRDGNYEIFLNGILIGQIETTGDIEKDQAAAMDFIKQNGLYVEPSEIKTMFRQALSFATTAAYLHTKDLSRSPWNVHSVAPFVVNSTFSIELYLKTLARAHGQSLRGHDLLELFELLPQEAHKTIESILPSSLRQWKPAGDVDLRTCISGLAKAFVEWRYLHEKSRTNTIYTDRVIFVLHVLHEACRSASAVG